MSDVFMENEALRGPGMDLLKHGADTYEDPEFCKEFGKMAALVDNNAEKGLEYLEKGAKKGCKECNVVIGKVLSPCSDIKCRRKNAEKALKNLEEAMDDPESQHEMAKIYMNGAEGIEKDLKKAKILQKQARKQSSNIPSLPEIEGSETLPFIIGASIVAGIGVTAFALYKLLRRNKK
ncbi:hypothetical protein TRFO_00853 [Tritrichomonas foetus]|uniref:Uncharacterized protein n=1 Tax=Tritrichomonas foetus TaxID=1144522 RepID=A0A1J4L6M5_9EUKA|nr:hypothetical protein TRFO_00853 [Tritrichomonas foetus]|eukprot:OHT17597.1 hypothetical protein TRFO_00853 [Tritrichomonas foetus]